MNRYISLQTSHGSLHGQLELPSVPHALILLLRSHHATVDSPLAVHLLARNMGVFAIELVTEAETHFADATQNVPRLTQRLINVLDLIRNDGDMQELPLGVYAHGDIVPAAIRATAQRDQQIKALACHGGLIDRSGLQALELVVAPLLQLFDADDDIGPAVFLRAASHLHCPHDMHKLEPGNDPSKVVDIWFSRHFSGFP